MNIKRPWRMWIIGLLAAFPVVGHAAEAVVDSYAAIVNDRVITIGDVVMVVHQVEMQLRELYSGEKLETEIAKLYKEGTETLIEQALIVEDFKSQQATLPDQIVNDEINRVIRAKFDNNRAAFLQALAEDRLTMDEWREQIRERLIVQIMSHREVYTRVAVSPQAVRRAYEADVAHYRIPETVHLRAIVLNKGTNDADRLTKLEEAQGIRKKLEAGESFAALAKTLSEGFKATQGGDMGWVEPSQLQQELVAAVAKLEPGQVSDVIETKDQFYILRLEERKKGGVTPFEQASSDIEQQLRKKEETRLRDAWIERLKRKFYVKIF